MSRAALALLCCALGASSAQAREVPLLRARVTDEAGALGGRAAALEARLADYERATGHQFAVLVVRSLDGEVLESFSIKVAERWRLGDRRRDDGLLLLVAIDDRAARIEVGYGLEGAIPDVVAGRVMREHMTPRFAAGDYAGGIEAGLDALMRAAKGEALGPAPRSRGVDGGERQWRPMLFFVVIGLSVLLRLPRLIRVPFGAALGAIIGWMVLESLLLAVGLALGLGVVALVLPTIRGGGRHRHGWIGAGSSSWGRSSGGFGGFSGGGGGFGGGGASGRW